MAMWKCMTGSLKNKMISNNKLIGTDGLVLIWVFLKMYQGTTSQVIQNTMRELFNPHVDINEWFHGNINKRYKHRIDLSTRLKDTGGADDQAYEQFNKTLKVTKNTKFNNILVVWYAIQDQIGTNINLDEMFVMTKM